MQYDSKNAFRSSSQQKLVFENRKIDDLARLEIQ